MSSQRAAWVGPVGADDVPRELVHVMGEGRMVKGAGILCPATLAEPLRAHWQRNLDDPDCPAAIPEGSVLGIRPADDVHLDAPGMGRTNDELLRLDLPDYAVTCYLLQAAGAVWMLDTISGRGPSYVLDGVPVHELRCHHHGVLIPTADLPVILSWLGQHAARSRAEYEVFAHRVASENNVHFAGLRSLPEG